MAFSRYGYLRPFTHLYSLFPKGQLKINFNIDVTV